MPIKITVKNFQSLREAEVDVLGLTTVTGSNNSGKTALMRAFKGVFSNTKGSAFVRYGETKSSVSVEFSDGQKVLWEKGPSVKPTYTLNHLDPIYPGQGVPEELQKLGVWPIHVAGREIWPQIAQQFTGQVFLLDQPGSVLAEALADVDRVGKLNGALKASESDRRAKNSDLKVRRADHEKLKEDLKKYDGLPDVLSNVEDIEKLFATGQKYTKAIENVSLLRDKIKRVSSLVSLLLGIETVDLPAGADPAERHVTLLDQLEPLQVRLQKVELTISKFDKIEKVKLPSSPHPSEETLKELNTLLPLRERLGKAQNTVTSLAGVETVDVPSCKEDLSKVIQEIKDHEALASNLSRLEKVAKKLAGIDKIKVDKLDTEKTNKTLGVLEETASLQKQLTLISSTEKKLVQELSETERLLRELEQEIVSVLGTFEQCPTCGNAEIHEGGCT